MSQSTLKLVAKKPPVKAIQQLESLAKQYPGELIAVERNILICRSCPQQIMSTSNARKFLIDQHIKTRKHEKSRKLKGQQKTMNELKYENEYKKDLCAVSRSTSFSQFFLNAGQGNLLISSF